MEIFLFITLLICIGINFFLIYKNWLQKKEPKQVEKKPKLTKEEKEKQKKIRESFDNLMNYDENIARARK
jgi:uncharacterized membrane protein